MRRGFAIDTGPLVAGLNGRDRHHRWARSRFEAAAPPLATCEAVISEACFLLRDIKGGPEAVFGLLERGVLNVPFRLADHQAAIRALMIKYADVPISVADACLVRMTEVDPGLTLLTLDRDFNVYRRNRRQAVPVILPE